MEPSFLEPIERRRVEVERERALVELADRALRPLDPGQLLGELDRLLPIDPDGARGWRGGQVWRGHPLRLGAAPSGVAGQGAHQDGGPWR